jgi:thiamine biosynthesis protein ThiS
MITMKIFINGEEREVIGGVLLSSLIEELGISCARVAVERNRSIVPPESFDKTELEEGDRLEIISFVGGG